jgi:hypothetical protein
MHLFCGDRDRRLKIYDSKQVRKVRSHSSLDLFSPSLCIFYSCAFVCGQITQALMYCADLVGRKT